MISCPFVALYCLLAIGAPANLGNSGAVLTQRMLDSARGSFVIKEDYNLLGQTLYVPEGLCLSFSKGSVDNGELRGSNSTIEVTTSAPVFGLDLRISGTWDVAEVHDGWFSFDESPEFVSNQIINNIFAFSSDSTPCHIFLEENRTYFFELPYKGAPNVGDRVSTRVVEGKTKRNYGDLLNDEFSFLRIFTIPSNTHLTVNNTLKMLPTNLGAYFVFWEYGKENVTIDGSGVIAGDNDWHKYNASFAGKSFYGEWGHIFRCIRCRNFTFKDITISDAFGDCIIFSGSFFPGEKEPRWASGLTIENVKILRARRNGVAVGARDVVIRHCHFEGCGTKEVRGTAPKSAIDFEPDQVKNYPEIGNQNVLMEDCTFKNNFFDVASYRNNLREYGKLATTIRNCVFQSPLKIEGTFWMRFENCYIPFVWNSKDDKSTLLYSRHMQFVNCEFGEFDASIVGTASRVANKYTNCKFNTMKK